MEKVHRKSLLSNRMELIAEIDADDITGYLYQYKVITKDIKDEIECISTRREKIEQLLDILPRRGPKAFECFCDILRVVKKYEHLADLLETFVNKRKKTKGNDDCIDGRRSSLNALKQLNFRPRSASKLKPDMLNAYDMISKPRGWCFILNNFDFFSLPYRSGSHVDAENLQNLFKLLGFRVWTLNNLTGREVKEKFIELSNKTDHTDCLIVCLLSHGVAGKIYGVDGELVSVSELLHMLNSGPISTLLKDKPKLFLIQACRVNEANHNKVNGSKQVHSSEVVTENKLISNEEIVLETFIDQSSAALQKHLLLGYSTFPGEVSWRNTSHGSFYIDSLVEVFENYASYEDVLSMLVKVNEVVGIKLAEHGVNQTPSPVFTTTKKLYFLPLQEK